MAVASPAPIEMPMAAGMLGELHPRSRSVSLMPPRYACPGNARPWRSDGRKLSAPGDSIDGHAGSPPPRKDGGRRGR
eukprot:scaffold10400_cov225-Isochrysis_galbana.AAC.3